MAFDTFLLIGDGTKVKGESTATGLTSKGTAVAAGWIEIFSFSWGASNPATVSAGKAGLSAGKVSVSSFNIMKKTELSSNQLMTACCTGATYPSATVVMRKATGAGKQEIFIEYDFTNVMVESIQWSGSSGGDDTPTESVSFAFAQFTINYTPQVEGTGLMGTPGPTASWDLTKVAAS